MRSPPCASREDPLHYACCSHDIINTHLHAVLVTCLGFHGVSKHINTRASLVQTTAFVKHNSHPFPQHPVPNPTLMWGFASTAPVTMGTVQSLSDTSKSHPDQFHDLYSLGPLAYLENTCSFRQCMTKDLRFKDGALTKTLLWFCSGFI